MKDKIQIMLNELNIKFTDEEIKALLVDGICLNERPLNDYIILKNLYDACNDFKNKDILLKRNLDEQTYIKISEVFG